MKKDNNRKRTGKGPATPRSNSPKKEERERKPKIFSGSRSESRIKKGDERFEKKARPNSGRSDHEGERRGSSEKPAYGNSNKTRESKNEGFASGFKSGNKKTGTDEGFDRKTSYKGKPQPSFGSSDRDQDIRGKGEKKSYGDSQKGKFGKPAFSKDSLFGKSKENEDSERKPKWDKKPRPEFGSNFIRKESDPAQYKTVYKGRGKDERPVYETVRNTDSDNTSAFKKNYKKSYDQDGTGISPKYNLDKVDKKFTKNKETDVFRLNRYISNSGICSRRDADVLIEKGEIKVNGEVVKELGYKVERKDRVTYKNKTINPEKPVYILLNKPKDFITTTDDPMERKTVMQLIGNACDERVFPVGRLDRNTTGLLLFTNDGELAAKLSHPSNEIKKIYQVTLDKPLTKNDEESILEGLTLEDGPVKVNDLQVLSKDKTILGLEIHSGKNRIVRRIFAHFGYDVIALDRVTYAGLTKKDLPRGKYRFLTEKEVINLKYLRKKK